MKNIFRFALTAAAVTRSGNSQNTLQGSSPLPDNALSQPEAFAKESSYTTQDQYLSLGQNYQEAGSGFSTETAIGANEEVSEFGDLVQEDVGKDTESESDSENTEGSTLSSTTKLLILVDVILIFLIFIPWEIRDVHQRRPQPRSGSREGPRPDAKEQIEGLARTLINTIFQYEGLTDEEKKIILMINPSYLTQIFAEGIKTFQGLTDLQRIETLKNGNFFTDEKIKSIVNEAYLNQLNEDKISQIREILVDALGTVSGVQDNKSGNHIIRLAFAERDSDGNMQYASRKRVGNLIFEKLREIFNNETVSFLEETLNELKAKIDRDRQPAGHSEEPSKAPSKKSSKNLSETGHIALRTRSKGTHSL